MQQGLELSLEEQFLLRFLEIQNTKDAIIVAKPMLRSTDLIALNENNIKTFLADSEGFMSIFPRDASIYESKPQLIARKMYARISQYAVIDIDRNKKKYPNTPLPKEIKENLIKDIMQHPLLKHFDAIVDSGGGLHIYYRWPTKPKKPEAMVEVTLSLLTKMDYLFAKYAEHIERDDGTAQEGRFIRIPGTINKKYEPAVKTRVLYFRDKAIPLTATTEIKEDIILRQSIEREQLKLIETNSTYHTYNDKIFDVLNAINIVFDTKQKLRYYKIKCPFPSHPERTPSFVIYKGTNGYYWYCFGENHPKDVKKHGTYYTLIEELISDYNKNGLVVPQELLAMRGKVSNEECDDFNNKIKEIFDNHKAKWMRRTSITEKEFNNIVKLYMFTPEEFESIHYQKLQKQALEVREKVASTFTLFGNDAAAESDSYIVFNLATYRYKMVTSLSKFRDALYYAGAALPITREHLLTLPHLDVICMPNTERVRYNVNDPRYKGIRTLEVNVWYSGQDEKYRLDMNKVDEAEVPYFISKLIQNLIPYNEEKREMFYRWLAALVFGKEKLTTSWVFYGAPGAGKDTLIKYVIAPIIGEIFVKITDTQQLSSQYNAPLLENTLLLVVNESTVDFKEASQMKAKLKLIVTNEDLLSDGKYRAQRKIRNMAAVMIFTNEIKGFRADINDRRFIISNTGPNISNFQWYEELIDGDGFNKLREEAYEFKHYLFKLYTNFIQHQESQFKAEMMRVAMKYDVDKEMLITTATPYTETIARKIVQGMFYNFLDDVMEEVNEYAFSKEVDTDAPEHVRVFAPRLVEELPIFIKLFENGEIDVRFIEYLVSFYGKAKKSAENVIKHLQLQHILKKNKETKSVRLNNKVYKRKIYGFIAKKNIAEYFEPTNFLNISYVLWKQDLLKKYTANKTIIPKLKEMDADM